MHDLPCFRPASLVFLFLLLLSNSAAAGEPTGQEDDPRGTWWGGVQLPGDFLGLALRLDGEEGAWRATLERPFLGRPEPEVEVEYDPPVLVLISRDSEGAPDRVFEGTLEGDVYRGEVQILSRGQSAPFVLRRIHPISAEVADRYLGDYRSESGERLVVERLPAATREDMLAITWTESGRSRLLFPVSDTEFVAGPDFEVPHPVEGRVTFQTGDAGVATGLVTRHEASGREQRARRPRLNLDEERIDAYVAQVLEDLDVPSISIGIVHGERLVHAQSFGVMNRETGEPATPDTLYQIASVTKVFTAMLLTILRDEGVVALDDPLRQFLPEAVQLPPTGSGGARDISLRHLVTHTSGFPLQPHNYVFEGRHNNNYLVAGLHECLDEVSLVFPTGSSWAYSNLGFVSLAHSLAQATGNSYEELLQSRILEPLGMNDSTVNFDAEDLERLATHYWSDDPLTPTPPWLPGPIAGQGGLSSTVRDMARFLSCCLRAERADAGPLSGASLREMQSPQARRQGGNAWIGYGWFIDRTRHSGELLSHSGFTGGHSSYLAISPALDVGIVVLTNFGFEPATRVGRWLITEVVHAARDEVLPTTREAQAYADRGDFGNAAWAYDALTDLDPENGAWHASLASASWELGRSDAASSAWQRAAELNHSRALSLFRAGRAEAALGRSEQALELLERAVAAGFRDRQVLEADPDLDPLRGVARFEELLAGLR